MPEETPLAGGTEAAGQAAARTAEQEAAERSGRGILKHALSGKTILLSLGIGVGFEAMDTHASLLQRVGGVIGTGAGYVANTAVAAMVGGTLGFALGVGVELGTYFAFRTTASMLEGANIRDQQRMRMLTRVGFQVSDVFHTNQKLLLTQRQEALQAIQGSIMNARSSLGREASIMRRSVDEYL